MDKTLGEEIHLSLSRIIEYLRDEEKNWKESGEPEDHIFNDVQNLKILRRSLSPEKIREIVPRST
jgi:hypothetical protein